MTGRTTVLGKVKGRIGGSCVTDAYDECAWCPALLVGANRNERKSERATSVSDAGRGRLPKEGSEVHAGGRRRAAKGEAAGGCCRGEHRACRQS